jgi:hypothetical protein
MNGLTLGYHSACITRDGDFWSFTFWWLSFSCVLAIKSMAHVNLSQAITSFNQSLDKNLLSRPPNIHNSMDPIDRFDESAIFAHVHRDPCFLYWTGPRFRPVSRDLIVLRLQHRPTLIHSHSEK